ncbi:MaoC family dehydratase N-terminal domain-containing protein [Pseudotabrizicola sp.]|uniref:FAS1-like dehydratase domain-containing protein n=1 Tax=Pseudotabrizicola sp. TaxID=2939647 RepID=UPI002721B851|nr:MaoC family dehydratase N-terminal domain-containing protein [Pseudotabrizicola sp.]MDO8882066.1 MaoC family dehydratase N-terminal domain-containing protein [Pseudotabrizicola sp.]
MTEYADWMQRSITRQDVVSDRLIGQMQSTLPDHLAPGPVPLGLFWTLAPDALTSDRLGRDGHPRQGIFLPELPLPRRMWAGGEIRFHGDLTPGDVVTKTSRIASIVPKSGSTGDLIFVTIQHDYAVGGQSVIDERQDLVYRADPAPGQAVPAYPPAPDLGPAIARRALHSDPVLLFRFSALTFNGHRIHYDADYARQTEGYDGLVVHGPLQAMVMLNMAAQVLGRTPARFTYRGLSPLIAGQSAVIEARQNGTDLVLRVVKPGGPVTMSASASA